MVKLKVNQFLDVVKRSGLVDDERLTEVLCCVDESVKDSGVIASAFTKAGLLTEWQSEKLLQGKHKGFHLGKYTLLSHIGTGGMGSVYLAEHRVMRHRVAIKLLPHHMAAQTAYLERFHLEARASAKLNHPNMVRAFDVDKDGDYHYLVMEYVDGMDLQAIVSRHGPLEFLATANYIRQAAKGLAYAHEVGLIHRDVKPANLLVDKEGTVKILDMGLARFADDSQASLTMAYDQKMIGTVDYLAPEQALDSHKVDIRADIYSLGCTLYFMLKGEAPFPQGTIPQRLMAHQKEEPADVLESRPDAPEELLAIRQKMMAKSPDDRYQNCNEIVEAITEFLGDGDDRPSSAAGPPPPEASGPSLNENLDLAPLEDESEGLRLVRRPGDSKVGGSKIGGSGAGSGIDSAVVPGPGIKKGGSSAARRSGHADSTTSDARADSAVTSPGKSGAKVPGRSGIRQPGEAADVSSAPVPKLPQLSKADDLVDQLMAAPTVPTQPMQGAPLPAPRKHEEPSGFNFLIVLGLGLLGAAIIGIVLYALLAAGDAIGL